MKRNIYALIDCDNFYVSCERIFRPDLINKPVVILSNNDGCIVSRSNEAKKIGIPMGIPYFKAHDMIQENNISVFSSNYPLYADISNRVVKTLENFSPNVDIYSIDEAFLTLNLTDTNHIEYGKQIRGKILKDVGIPTTVGIAYTKTLTKVATKIGKKNIQYQGVLSLLDIQNNDQFLELVEVGDIWGVGRKYSEWLNTIEIKNAKQLKYADQGVIRKRMTVQGLRTVLELNNIDCIQLQKYNRPKKSINSSKSFGKKTDSLEEIKKSLAINIARAGERLREQNCVTDLISIYICSNPFKTPYYSNSQTIKLPCMVSDTPTLIKYSFIALEKIFRKDYLYKNCGIYISNINPINDIQLDLFQNSYITQLNKKTKIMESIDILNKKWGRDTVKIGAMGITNDLKMKQDMISPRYTTDWNDLLVVTL